MRQSKESIMYLPSQDPSKTRQVKAVMIQMGVRIKNLTPDMSAQQVGYLAGCKGFEEKKELPEEQEITDEILILKDFSEQRLNELLINLRKAKIPKIQLKAVLNENNKFWTLSELYKELLRENWAMSEIEEEKRG